MIKIAELISRGRLDFQLAAILALIFASSGVFQASGVSARPEVAVVESRIEVAEPIRVGEGQIFDGTGALYSWVGPGDCSQVEGMPPMFILASGATLQNVRMENAPDGIHIRGSNVIIDNIVNLDVCEDAISITRGKNDEIHRNIVISNSKFFDCADKAIQLTRGQNVLITDNEFHRCAKAIRVKEKATDVQFVGNSVYDAKAAIKVTGGHGVATGNLFDGGGIAIWAEKGGRFADQGGNIYRSLKEKFRETTGGVIERYTVQ